MGIPGLLILLLLASVSAATSSFGEANDLALSWARQGSQAFEIRLDDEVLGELRPGNAGGFRLSSGSVEAVLSVDETPLNDRQPYPRRVRIEGRLTGSPAGFRNEYTLLAPAAPIFVEGYGLIVADDAPGTNDREHAALQNWLESLGLPADTGPFQELHLQETGRDLRVWYEISGRRVDGRFAKLGGEAPLALIDSLFRSEGGGLKIHHKRPGENGRFDYHRESLELAASVAALGEETLVGHECGCYGYAVAGDFMTLGSALYQVEADWLDDRVGAEFFVGFVARPAFPWIGIGDRLRMRNLARRARAFILKDASGERFAQVSLDLPEDPPKAGLGPIAYQVDRFDSAGEPEPVARIEREEGGVRIVFPEAEGRFAEKIRELDQLLAAMPIQVMRGDGVRDSHLLEIERLVDGVRLLATPDQERLADFVSDVDASSAARKVRALLDSEATRFEAAGLAVPPAPIPGPGAANRQVRRADGE